MTDQPVSGDRFADTRPRVAQPSTLWPLVLGVLGALALGVVVFLQMTSERTRIEEARIEAKRTTDERASAEARAAAAKAAENEHARLAQQPAPLPTVKVDLAPPAPPPPGPTQAELDRLKAPAVVVELGDYKPPEGAGAPAQTPSSAGGSAGRGVDAAALSSTLGSAAARSAPLGAAGTVSADERFAERFGVGQGASSNKPAIATRTVDLANTVLEGSLIPALLETALNSDLPGYVRAVVTRDVRGYDGSKVLIPRGSRLVGQYRAGVALGQSRAFVIWTRLIRPDGAAVELASPATDSLGRGGLSGEVDRHFLQRFGGGILLSLLNVGASALADSADTQIVIAATRGGTDAAGVALSKDLDIAPTVKVAQGTPVRVFVSRDLDFSQVGAAEPSVGPPGVKPVGTK